MFPSSVLALRRVAMAMSIYPLGIGAGRNRCSLRDHDKFHTIVLRSTVPPGTTRRFAIPILEEMSGRAAGIGFEIYFNPEFLREGCSIRDFHAPPYIVIGKQKNMANGTLRKVWEDMKIEAPSSTWSFRKRRFSNMPATPSTRLRFRLPMRLEQSAKNSPLTASA
jgi:hypothetical protein